MKSWEEFMTCIFLQMLQSTLRANLPSWTLDINRRPHGSLGHTVYRKPTHTKLHPKAESPPPSQ